MSVRYILKIIKVIRLVVINYHYQIKRNALYFGNAITQIKSLVSYLLDCFYFTEG